MLREQRTSLYETSDLIVPNGRFDSDLFHALHEDLSNIDKHLEILQLANRYYEQEASQLPETLEILTNELPLNAFQIDTKNLQDHIKQLTEQKESLDNDFSIKLFEIIVDLHILLDRSDLSSENASLLRSLEERLERPSLESLKECIALAEKIAPEQFGLDALNLNKALSCWTNNLHDFFKLGDFREAVMRDIAKAQSDMGRSHHIATNADLIKLVNNVSSRATGLGELKDKIIGFCENATSLVEKLYSTDVISFNEASELSSLLDQMCSEPNQDTLHKIINLVSTHAIWSEFGIIRE